MKLFLFEWNKEVNMNCRAEIRAKNKEEAFKKFKEGLWDRETYEQEEVDSGEPDAVIAAEIIE